MKVKELNMKCGECCLIDYCDEPFSDICICTDNRFKERKIEEVIDVFKRIGDKLIGDELLDKVYEDLRKE